MVTQGDAALRPAVAASDVAEETERGGGGVPLPSPAEAAHASLEHEHGAVRLGRRDRIRAASVRLLTFIFRKMLWT